MVVAHLLSRSLGRRQLSDVSGGRAQRLRAAVSRLQEHGADWAQLRARARRGASSKQDKGGLKHGWWRLEERNRRSPSLAGLVTSYATSWMVHYADVLSDGRFEEGAVQALETLHQVVGEGDVEALRRFCDAPLAASLAAAVAEARATGYTVEHGVDVLEKPRIAWWRVAVGLERNSATWETTEDGRAVAVDDWCALDARARIGLLLVLPRDQFEPIRAALESGSVRTVYEVVSTAVDDHTVSVQAAVDFPAVKEALIAWTHDGSEPSHFWTGSTGGFATTARQLIFETAAYRAGLAVDEPTWRLVDVDNLLDGGAPYWRSAIMPE